MLRSRYILLFLLTIFFATSVCAEDIAYIVKDTSRLNHDFLNAIKDLGLTAKVIDDDGINSVNLSDYKIILVGNDRFANPQNIPVNDFPTLIVNQYHMADWYWSSGISFVSNSQPLSARNVYSSSITRGLPGIVQVYDSCCYQTSSIPMYYLSKEKRSLKLTSVTSTMSDASNAVIAMSTKGTLLKSGYTSKAKAVFFGITESYMWTQDAETLFKNSILWIINEPPYLNASIPAKSWNEDSSLVDAYTLSEYFIDKEKDNITYSMIGGAHIKANIIGGKVTLYADPSWYGSEQVRFVATEENQFTQSNLVTLTVNHVNHPPVLAPISDLIIVESDFLDVNATSTDVDHDTVSITYSSPLNSNGEWQTKVGDAGTYTINVTADDFRGGIDTKAFQIDVLPKVYVNEFSLEGWVELYNPSVYDIDLNSWILSSSTNQVTLNSIIKSKDFLVVNINLSSSDKILLKKDSNVIDSVAFGSFNDGNAADNAPSPLVPKSVARKSDGYDASSDKLDFIILDLHTKGLSNTEDVTPPVVNLVNPTSGFVLTDYSRRLSLSFSVSDNKATDLNCELFMDDSGIFKSLSTTTVYSSNLGVFDLSGLQDGGYLWNVRCFDGRNYAFAQANRTFVVDVNDPPQIISFTPQNSGLEIYENSSIEFTQASSDPEAQQLRYSWRVDNIEKSTSSTFVYLPGFSESGNHIVKLIVIDSGNLTADVEWGVKVINVNRNPYVVSQIPIQTFDEDKTHSLVLGDYFKDDDSNGISYEVVGNDSSNVICEVLLSRLYMNPSKDFNGEASCTIVASDGEDNSGLITIPLLVSPVNDAPKVKEDISGQSWDEDMQKADAIKLSDYFYDVDSEYLAYTVSGNSNIIVTITDDLVSFSQPEDWSGVEYVKFTASDGALSVQSNSIRLNVRNVNDDPEITPIPTLVLDEDASASLDISQYFQDKEADHLTYNVTGKDSNKVDCTVSGHNLVVKPALNFNGASLCSIIANDGSGNSEQNTMNVIVNAINDAPVFKGNIPSKTWDEDTPLNDVFDLGDYFQDVDNDGLTYTVSGNTNIKVEITPGNKVSFSQPENWFGSETIVFTASDGSLSVSSNNVLLKVIDVDEPPVMDAVPEQSIHEDSGSNEIALIASDIDGTIASFSIDQKDVSKVDCSMSSNILKMVPAKDFFGSASCTVKVTDNSGSTDSKVVAISVVNVNDAPVIDSSSPSVTPLVTEDGSQQFSLSYHDIDTPNSGVSVTWYVNDVLAGSGNAFTYVAAGKGLFEIKAVVSDSEHNVSKSWNLTATDCPISGKFDGSTTKFCELSQEQLSNLDCVVFEKVGYGKIDFCGAKIDLNNTLYLDKHIDISPGFIAFNTGALPNFANKPATITIYNVNSGALPPVYYSPVFVLDPKVVNLLCPSSICSNMKFVDNKLEFKVSSLSAFKVLPSEGNPVNSTIDSTCNGLNGYTCSSTDVCPTHWLNASDASHCCSVACTPNSIPDPGNDTTPINETFNNIKQCKAGIVGELDVNIKEPKSGDDFKPGEKIPVEIKIRNNAKEDLDVDVQAVLYDKNEEDEIDSDSDNIDVSEGDSETLTIDLNIPDSIKEKHSFIIYAKAFEKGNEEQQCNEDIVSIDLKREKHDVMLDEYKVSPPTLSCDKVLAVSFNADNIGKDDESLYFTVQQPSLGTDFRSELFNLKKDDDIFRSVNVAVPQNMSPGVYPVELTLFFGGGSVADSTILDLNVVDCVAEGTEKEGILTQSGISSKGLAKVELLKSYFEVEQGASFAIPLRVINTGPSKTTFSFGVSGASSYASLLDADKLTLNPGDSSTVYVYIRSNPDASLGSNSASIDINADGLVVDSKKVSVDIVKSLGKSQVSPPIFMPFNMNTSNLLLIIFTALVVFVIIFALVWSRYKPRRRYL